jgi:hypothetical protein
MGGGFIGEVGGLLSRFDTRPFRSDRMSPREVGTGMPIRAKNLVRAAVLNTSATARTTTTPITISARVEASLKAGTNDDRQNGERRIDGDYVSGKSFGGSFVGGKYRSKPVMSRSVTLTGGNVKE